MLFFCHSNTLGVNQHSAINNSVIMSSPPWVLYMPWSVSTEILSCHPWARSPLSACILSPSSELRRRFWFLLPWLAGCQVLSGPDFALMIAGLPAEPISVITPLLLEYDGASPSWCSHSWLFGPWGIALAHTLCSAIISLIPILSRLIPVWGQWSVQADKKS